MINYTSHPNDPWKNILLYRKGNLYWLTGRNTGMIAGGYDSYGHHTVKYENKQYRSARVIYEIHNGPISSDTKIGYEDGDRTNRNINNLIILDKNQLSDAGNLTKIANLEQDLTKLQEAKSVLDLDDPCFMTDFKRIKSAITKIEARLARLKTPTVDKEDKDINDDADIDRLMPTRTRGAEWEADKAAALAQIEAMFKSPL